MKKIYEFLLWDNCNNNCRFCWQREQPRIYNQDKRIEILNEVIRFINSDRFIKGSHVLVCGGEIFDKPQDYEYIVAFFQKIVEYMEKDVIGLLYINTNLIYWDTKGLMSLFKMLENSQYDLLPRLRFTTSYDIEGRFKDKHNKDLMLTNLKFIAERYTNVHIVVNTILTRQACNAILNNEFKIDKFMKQYNCWVNLIPYIVLDEELTADRTLIFKTLEYVDKICPNYLEKYVPNMTIKQEKWLYMYKNNEFQFCSCELSPECGHAVNFKKYSKEGTCFCCDLEGVFN